MAPESYHNLQKAWFTPKLKELPSFVLVACLKAMNLTIGIGTHDILLKNLFRLLDGYWLLILSKFLKLNTVNMCLSLRAYSSNP